jgi:hypothetical protein
MLACPPWACTVTVVISVTGILLVRIKGATIEAQLCCRVLHCSTYSTSDLFFAVDPTFLMAVHSYVEPDAHVAL